MTNDQIFALCYQEAVRRTSLYKEVYPVEAYNYVGTTTLLVAALVTSVISAGVSAYGMYEQGQAQKKMGEYNAKIAQNNATAAKQQADAESARIRARGNRLRGAQVASASKSGLILSGSVNDVIFDSSVENELDALTSLYKGRMTASSFQSQAVMSRFEGDTAASLGTIGAGGTLLSGAAQSFGYGAQIDYYSRTNQQPGFKN